MEENDGDKPDAKNHDNNKGSSKKTAQKQQRKQDNKNQQRTENDDDDYHDDDTMRRYDMAISGRTEMVDDSLSGAHHRRVGDRGNMYEVPPQWDYICSVRDGDCYKTHSWPDEAFVPFSKSAKLILAPERDGTISIYRGLDKFWLRVIMMNSDGRYGAPYCLEVKKNQEWASTNHTIVGKNGDMIEYPTMHPSRVSWYRYLQKVRDDLKRRILSKLTNRIRKEHERKLQDQITKRMAEMKIPPNERESEYGLATQLNTLWLATVDRETAFEREKEFTRKLRENEREERKKRDENSNVARMPPQHHEVEPTSSNDTKRKRLSIDTTNLIDDQKMPAKDCKNINTASITPSPRRRRRADKNESKRRNQKMTKEEKEEYERKKAAAFFIIDDDGDKDDEDVRNHFDDDYDEADDEKSQTSDV